jgi:hypothetical protein
MSPAPTKKECTMHDTVCNTLNLGVEIFFPNIHQIQVLLSNFFAFLLFFPKMENYFVLY